MAGAHCTECSTPMYWSNGVFSAIFSLRVIFENLQKPSGHLQKSSKDFRVIQRYPSMGKRRFTDVVWKLYAPGNRLLLMANHNRRAEQT